MGYTDNRNQKRRKEMEVEGDYNRPHFETHIKKNRLGNRGIEKTIIKLKSKVKPVLKTFLYKDRHRNRGRDRDR